MFDRIKTRLSSEEGFTLIELLVVIVILGILVAIAVPSYLSLRGNAQDAAAMSNVRSAIPAAEEFYQTQNPATYTGMTAASLNATAPGISPNVQVFVSLDGNAYCLDDTEATGHDAYYIGGDQNLQGDGHGFKALTGTYKVSVVSKGNVCADFGATQGS